MKQAQLKSLVKQIAKIALSEGFYPTTVAQAHGIVPVNEKDFHEDRHGVWCGECGEGANSVSLGIGKAAYVCSNPNCKNHIYHPKNESMTTRAELDAGTMKAVNVEAAEETKPWKEIDSGVYQVGGEFAKKLAGGKLPVPGMEKLVAAPPGFSTKRGHVWLVQTNVGKNLMVWSIRDAGNWRLIGGLAVLSDLIPFESSTIKEARNLSVPDKHQMKIAIQTLRAPDAMVGVMGGMNKEEARNFLKQKIGLSDGDIQRIEDAALSSVDEMTGTGAVAGYSTPFAFSKKNKEGSPRGIAAAKKYGTVVKSITEEEKM